MKDIAIMTKLEKQLLEAVKKLAWFIENVNPDDTDSTENFFKVREIWRDAIAAAESPH